LAKEFSFPAFVLIAYTNPHPDRFFIVQTIDCPYRVLERLSLAFRLSTCAKGELSATVIGRYSSTYMPVKAIPETYLQDNFPSVMASDEKRVFPAPIALFATVDIFKSGDAAVDL
jgi:hypothetical protein